MIEFEEIKNRVPLPVVDLTNISKPHGGLLIPTNKFCNNKFEKDHKCKLHYENLRNRINSEFEQVQCPYGFSSVPLVIQNLKVAFTAVIPFPRNGGQLEKRLSKQFPQNKIAIASIKQMITNVHNTVEKIEAIERESLEKYSMALHEIRKLNAKVKQTAEKICNKQKPEDPDNANSDLVLIWKSAEMMSYQFDIIEILANQTLITLPLRAETQIYRLLDKCIKIYEPGVGRKILRLQCPKNYDPKAIVCNQTFPLLFTVLIHNAIKYNLNNKPIDIEVKNKDKKCEISFTNFSNLSVQLDESIFERGIRINRDKDGSGYGLYIAQSVAKQHKTMIKLKTINEKEFQRVTFSVEIETKN